MSLIKPQVNHIKICYLAILIIALIPVCSNAQDTSSSILDINKLKLVKKAKSIVDSTRNKINEKVYDKVNNVTNNLTKKVNAEINNLTPKEELEERPLPSELLLNKKYTLTRRAYQNTVSQFNYLFNAEEELKEIIQKSRASYKEDYEKILSFYDYDLATISKYNIDSIIYRCNANIVLHDLRSNWVDDAYLLLAKSYLFHRNFDTAGSILQFINYSFDEKSTELELPIGSNLRNSTGKFSIANKDDNSIWKNGNVRNESMIWQARNYIESNQINEALSLLQLLKADADFPKKLHPFLNEQFAYVYYSMESYELAASHLVEALPNALDDNAKSRWYFLIAQLWQKANNINKAYYWYKKASQFSPNPIIGVYATINMIRIEAEKTNSNWQSLANELEKITKREKYKPYKDIIYFEMANLAIQNKAFDKANDWLITSIKNNFNNSKQKQSAFELMGEINYNNNKFAISKIAYDSLSNVLKTNPNFDQITLRKKWLTTIVNEINNIETEDTLQYIYKMPSSLQMTFADAWQKRSAKKTKYLKDIFSDNRKEISNLELQNQFVSGSANYINKSGNFYFENNNTITQGKQSFIQKWGERPNVDNWRRKTSNSIANLNSNNLNSSIDTANTYIKVKDDKLDSNKLNLLKTDNEYSISRSSWNKAALSTAQTFLLKLNDFEKAKPLYRLIVEKNIDPIVTERALLDLASQYLHIGEKEISDNIIKTVMSKYPNGSYMQKKQEAEAKLKSNVNTDNLYKDAYFLSQIGNWSELSNLTNSNNAVLIKSKWYIPVLFLKVKMYAQLKEDTKAINILDSVIRYSKNEILKERASNLINEIKNRKDTEQYLSNLQLEKILEDSIEKKNESSVVGSKLDTTSSQQKILINNVLMKDSLLAIKLEKNNTTPNEKLKIKNQNSRFVYDSLETHYIALITNNTNGYIATLIKDSLLKKYRIEFISRKIGTTISQVQENAYIIWIGPFENAITSTNFLINFAPVLKKELNDYISGDKYELQIIGKSNIIKIKSLADFKEYKTFILNNIINQ